MLIRISADILKGNGVLWGEGLLTMLASIPALLLSLIGGLWHWTWRGIKKRRQSCSHTISQTYPEDDAYRTLQRIAAMDLPGLGIFQQHYVMIMSCLASYFQAVYGVEVSSANADQWQRALLNAGVDETVGVLVREIAALASRAQQDQSPQQTAVARHVVHTARHIIDVTKPQR